MKQTIKVFILFFVIAAFAFIPPKHSIVGKWRTSENDGTHNYISFTSGGTFNYQDLNGKTIHKGKYKYFNDTFSISDDDCGAGYWARYKLTFLGTDSVSFAVIEDSCSGRENDINGAGLRRLKRK
ncbi:MAG: hypothetical protein Q8891_17710 [Bacteroidota bacterium]|nr:hypothetical protein [Bacteroidota bacterium]